MGLADLLCAAGCTGHSHARIYAHRATVGIFFNKNRVQKATKKARGRIPPAIHNPARIDPDVYNAIYRFEIQFSWAYNT